MTCAVPPTAFAPSWTPLHENSLKDLSSSWPISVTMPTFGPALPGPGVPAPPQAETMSATSRVRTSDRLISGLDLPYLAARGEEARRATGREYAIPQPLTRQRGALMRRGHRPLVEPDDIHDEGGVEDPERCQLAPRDRVPGAQEHLQQHARGDG